MSRMTMSNSQEVFLASFQQLLMQGVTVGLDLCAMTELCLWELAQHYVAQHGDKEAGLAHLSGHL